LEAEQVRNGEVVEMEIPSAPEYVAIVRRMVEGIARRMSFDTGQVEDLKLAVGEACTNAVRHGCPKNGSGNVEIRFVVMQAALLVEVTNGIQGCESPSLCAEPDLGKEGGLGLYIIRQLVDEVDILWQDETATVKMLKRLSVQPAT
jgi:serine/threonine-protein kinase RsbW